jgi:hypothetical protein
MVDTSWNICITKEGYPMGFKEYMAERKEINRWFVLRVALIGAFVGALLATMFTLLGLVKV